MQTFKVLWPGQHLYLEGTSTEYVCMPYRMCSSIAFPGVYSRLTCGILHMGFSHLSVESFSIPDKWAAEAAVIYLQWPLFLLCEQWCHIEVPMSQVNVFQSLHRDSCLGLMLMVWAVKFNSWDPNTCGVMLMLHPPWGAKDGDGNRWGQLKRHSGAHWCLSSIFSTSGSFSHLLDTLMPCRKVK